MSKINYFSAVIFFLFATHLIFAAQPFTRSQFTPPSQIFSDKSFNDFLKKLKTAIAKKDKAYLISIVDKNVKYTFGDINNKKEFLEIWDLDKKNNSSQIWGILTKILSIGGILDPDGKKYYIFPYPHTMVSSQIKDPCYIVGKDVNVREKPSSKSKVIETLSHEIVTANIDDYPEPVFETVNNEKYQWYKVDTYSGKTGFVFGKYFWNPYEYRAYFEKINGKWMLTTLIAGD